MMVLRNENMDLMQLSLDMSNNSYSYNHFFGGDTEGYKPSFKSIHNPQNKQRKKYEDKI